MEITIEQNKVVVNLDESEFPIFEAMFANLEDNKTVKCEFREFNGLSGSADINLLPMHLCRTIGEGRHGRQQTALTGLFCRVITTSVGLRRPPVCRPDL